MHDIRILTGFNSIPNVVDRKSREHGLGKKKLQGQTNWYPAAPNKLLTGGSGIGDTTDKGR